jgi:hypothetical protein
MSSMRSGVVSGGGTCIVFAGGFGFFGAGAFAGARTAGVSLGASWWGWITLCFFEAFASMGATAEAACAVCGAGFAAGWTACGRRDFAGRGGLTALFAVGLPGLAGVTGFVGLTGFAGRRVREERIAT